jgi:energy-coupling factor transporter transmembrane protein EcfT
VRRLFFALAAALAFLYSAFVPQVFAAALILAFGVRLAYVLLRWSSRRPLLSGWIFVIALGLLLMVAVRAPGPETRRANAAAARQGLVAKEADARPRDRCVGRLLDWWDENGARQAGPGWTKARFRIFLTRVCRRADEQHVLKGDGEIEPRALPRLWIA